MLDVGSPARVRRAVILSERRSARPERVEESPEGRSLRKWGGRFRNPGGSLDSARPASLFALRRDRSGLARDDRGCSAGLRPAFPQSIMAEVAAGMAKHHALIDLPRPGGSSPGIGAMGCRGVNPRPAQLLKSRGQASSFLRFSFFDQYAGGTPAPQRPMIAGETPALQR